MVKRRGKQKAAFKTKIRFDFPKKWNRYERYLLYRLNRLGSSPRAIAKGVACGVAISFTPFVGLHLVLAAVTAFLCRGNIIAAALGTAAGNPWTFPIIWVSVFYTGKLFLGSDASENVSFLQVFEKGMHSLVSFDFSAFMSDVWPVVFPMIVGCIPYYIISWLLTYYIVERALTHINDGKKQKRNVI